MQTGDIVRATSINAIFEGEKTRCTMSFRAPKGQRFVFLVLGRDTKSLELDPKVALAYLGYIPDAALAQAPQKVAETCAWTHDESEYSWDSACGSKWGFVDGGPIENGMKFCHNCGKPLKVIAAAPTESK
jgi:hypothetical protein